MGQRMLNAATHVVRDIIFPPLLTALALCGAQSAGAQAYPSKPIRYIVPYSAGVLPDFVARTIAPEMAVALGQPIIVENRPSAGALVGYEYVAKQAGADGYTVASLLVQDLAILPLVVKDLRFDPQKDITPVIGLAEATLVFGSSITAPWKTLDEMVAVARANPGKFNHGGSSFNIRLSNLMVLQHLGLDLVYIPYTAGAALLQAQLTGEVHAAFLPEANAISFGDKFRVLAVTSERRLASFPNAVTTAEYGLPRIPSNSYALGAPAGVPKPIIDRLHGAASRALRQPEVRAQLEKRQLSIVEQSTEVAAKSLAEKAALYAGTAKRAGIEPQ